jgi:hypothetical protein
VKKEEAFRRIESAVRAGRAAARKIGADPNKAERTIRTDVYVEETTSGVFRIRVWKNKIHERALAMGVGADEAKNAINQYEAFFNE